MLFFTDRKFETICIAGSKDLPILDDEFNENVETGTGILKAVVPKSHNDAEKIEVGNFVLSNDYKKETVALEVMEIFETRNTKEIIAEDAGLDLLNDEAGPIDMKGTLEDFAKATLGDDSSWDIGLNEIDPKKTMTLSYEEIATQTKRINQIAGRFDAEVSYSFNFKGNTILQKLVNFHKKRGKEIGQRIEIGKGLEDVRRHISITNLCTAIRPVGEPYQKTVKVVVPYNLLRASNRETSTKNYKVGEWQFAEEIKAGEEVTLTFKGVISPLQKFRVYNSGSNHSLAILEKVGDGIYSATFNWAIGSEGNTSLWAYQYPDRGTNNDTCLIEWAVLTKGKEVATKWLPSKADESGAEIPSATTASETITIGTLDGDARIEKMVQWFKSREGKVGYDDGSRRFGPNYYDCSSSVLIAAKHAGLMPSSAPTRNTDAMMSWGNAGTYFHQISSSQVKRGDIFVSRTSSSGHTGLFLDNGKTIIHTTVGAGKRGIMTTPAKGWLGTGTIKYFRFNVLRDTPTQTVGITQKAVSSGTFWTNSDITRHDIGKSLQGLTAQQLNNWIQAKSPSSPFRGQGAVFLEAQKQSGLDARIILAHAAHESAWGKSDIAKNLHNYFGINAYDSDPYTGAKKSANSGLTEGIINGAKWVAKNYYNNPKYNQKTLYSMRYNNGAHEYATDPTWHTKIANIAKGSEPFTKSSSIVTGASAMGIIKSVPDIKYEDTTIEVELNLKGYKYDDGRYFVNEKGEICDREGLERWGRFKGYSNERSGYILRVYESEATTQEALLDEGLLQLQKNATPFIDYEVSLAYLPEGVELGDTVRIIDHEYQPALYLDARLVDITKSSTDRRLNKAVFSNFVERESGINEKLLALQNMAKSLKWTWDSQPYTMDLVSSLGNLFKDGVISTDLIANITRMGIDQTSAIDYFIWERVSEYQDKLNVTDESWNATKQLVTGNVLHVTADDVDMQASFTCSAVVDGVVVASAAYTIKDLTIGIYKQEEEPNRTLLSWGDVWQWDDGSTPFKRVWKGDRWEDTVTKRDLELLELTPGPPGADGHDGLPGAPGADGKTSYVHFAYADSADGVVGFTRTATNGKKYIGMYVDFIKADSDNPSDYAWSLFKGADGTNGTPGKDGVDGLPGQKGTDGKTSYVHFAYADSADGKTGFSLSAIEGKAYIGMYTDFVQADSTDPEKYHWSLFKGEDGRDGANGIPGKAGEDGKTPYFHTAWATNSTGTTGFSTTVSTDKIYIGTYTDFIQTDSTDPTKYKWVKIKGEDGQDGIPGKAGIDGKTPYFHQAWANSADGITDFSTTNSTDKIYIGTYVDFVQADSTDPSSYSWMKVRGNDGAKGDTGPAGADGKTGQLGSNLLEKSNIPVIDTTAYLISQWNISESLKNGETITITFKASELSGTRIRYDVFNSSEFVNIMYGVPKIKDNIFSVTKTWKGETDTPNNQLKLYGYPNTSEGNTPISLDWIVLQRGDIPAVDWVPNYNEVNDAIDSKVGDVTTKVEELQVHLQQFPPAEMVGKTAEEITKIQRELEVQSAYLKALENAIETEALSLSDRVAIVEVILGAGKLSMEAITTYFEFGEEGIIVGKQNEQVKMNIVNDALVFIDGTKEVVRIANNYAYMNNLQVEGVFEFAHHMATTAIDEHGMDNTVFRSKKGGTL